MKRTIAAIVVGIAVLAVLFRSSISEAWKHYQLFQSVQSTPRIPYHVVEKDDAFFATYTDRKTWRVAPSRDASSTAVWDQVFETVKWDPTMESALRFYTTDTRDIGVFEWLLHPDCARLPTLQEMSFRRKDGGELFIDASRSKALEIVGKSMAVLLEPDGPHIRESLLVTEEVFERMSNRSR